MDTWCCSCLRHHVTSLNVAGSIPSGVIGIFYTTQCFWPHYSPGVNSTSKRNEYQEYLLPGKSKPMCRADNLTTFMCILSRNSGSLNLLDP